MARKALSYGVYLNIGGEEQQPPRAPETTEPGGQAAEHPVPLSRSSRGPSGEAEGTAGHDLHAPRGP